MWWYGYIGGGSGGPVPGTGLDMIMVLYSEVGVWKLEIVIYGLKS